MTPGLLPSQEPTEPVQLAAPPPVGFVARWLSVLAYAGGVIGLGLLTALPIYLVARRRSTFVAFHALQSLTVGLWALVDVAIGGVGLYAVHVGSSTIAAAVVLGAVFPALLLLWVTTLLALVGMREATCGRRTPLPYGHALADRHTIAG